MTPSPALSPHLAAAEKVVVAAAPIDIAYADPATNLAVAQRAVEQAAASGADLVVLPELFSTGYVRNAERLRRLGQTNDGATMSTVRQWATRLGVGVAGSFLAVNGTDDNRWFNRAFLVDPSRGVEFYSDKRHLFTFGGEDAVYAPGAPQPATALWRGWRVRLIVCYDLRFPVWCRSTTEAPYDLLLCPANWPASRRQAWDTLLKARAIENLAYAVGANRLGKDMGGDYPADMTRALDFMGRTLAEASGPAPLDPQMLADFRNTFPAILDADPFTLT